MRRNQMISTLLAIIVCLFVLGGTWSVSAQTPTEGWTESPEARYQRWVKGDVDWGLSERFMEKQKNSDVSSAIFPSAQSDAAILVSNFVFSSFRDNNWEIYGLDHFNWLSSSVRLTNHSADDLTPRARPGSNQFVFTSKRTGNYELFLGNMSGTILQQLTGQSGYDGQPAWSADGNKLVYVSEASGNMDIYSMNPDGSNKVRLTSNTAAEFDPCWSPDGLKIAYVQAIDNQYGALMVMNSDGSNSHSLKTPLRYLGHPIWSPDGTRILFDYDSNLDGWNDLGYYVLAQDQINMIRVASPLQDYWAGDWTVMISQEILYTKVYYVVYNNVLYIDSSNVWASPLTNPTDTDYASGWYNFYPDSALTDLLPPESRILPLQRYTRIDNTYLNVQASDPGPALLDSIDICKRREEVLNWDCFTDPYLNQDPLNTYYGVSVDVGYKYYFASRVRDQATNEEPAPALEGDTSTYFYQSELSGRVIDNRGYPLPQAVVITSPVFDDQDNSDKNGRFHRYAPGRSLQLAITKDGYEDLYPQATLDLMNDRSSDWALPPQDDLIVNGSFNLQQIEPWVFAGFGQYTNSYALEGLSLGLEPANPTYVGKPFKTSAENTVSPRIAVDSLGTAHAVWVDRSVENVSRIFYSQRLAGASWSTSEIINLQTLMGSTEPSIALGGDGTVHLVFAVVNQTMMRAELIYTSRAPSGTWTPPVSLASAIALFQNSWVNPRIVLDSMGKLNVTYTAMDGSYYLFKPDSGGWSTPALVGQGLFIDDLKFDPNDTMYAVSATAGSGVQMIAHLPDGGWGAPETISGLPANRVQLEIDPDSRFILIWRNNLNYLETASRPTGGEWTQPLLLSPGGGSLDFDLILSGKSVHLAWQSTNSILSFRKEDQQGNWSSILHLEYAYPPFQPGVSLAVQGDQDLLLWVEQGWSTTSAIYLTEWSLPKEPNSSISQTVTLPPTMRYPTLSFFHRTGTIEPACELRVEVNDTPIFSTNVMNLNWTHAWVDLSPWVGQTVVVKFIVENNVLPCQEGCILDDISLGSFVTPIIESITPAPIDTGVATEVTLDGKNFSEFSEVYLNDTRLSGIQFVNEHTLQVELPGLNVGFYELRVTNPNGLGTIGRMFLVGKPAYLPAIRR
jgi:hypothetical protein